MISKLRTKQPIPTYEFIEDPINDTTHIHITSGTAAGVVFRYGRVRFEEIAGQLNVKFGYELIRNPDLLTDAVVKPIIIGILNTILIEEGTDVTDYLHVLKYEPPIPAELSGKVKGGFPSFLRKTDEERVQNLEEQFLKLNYRSDHKFYVTEKLDGSSATFYFRNGQFGVCSRNLELLETPDNTFWKVARELQIEEKLGALGVNICLQGELIGEGIQGNPYKIKGHTVKFFNAFDIDNNKKLVMREFVELIEKLEFDYVPFLALDFLLPHTVDGMLQWAEGKSGLNPNTEREGVVIRSYDMSISFKAISNKFLLKNEK